MPHLTVEIRSLIHLFPLFLRQVNHIAGDAHHAQESVDQGIVDPPDAVCCLQNSPDLALRRQNHPVQLGRDDRDFRTLMGV